MLDTLRLLGDGFSIAALSIVCSASWQAMKRIPADARVPFQFNRQGEPARRLRRNPALWFTPALALFVLLSPTFLGVTFRDMSQEDAVMLFAARALLGGAFAAAHLLHLSRAMAVLRAEGVLRS